MNLILFSLIFILFTFNTQAAGENYSFTLDILPDFIGYLILWLCLEKRRFSKRMHGLYTAAAILLPVTFLCFAGQVKSLFITELVKDARNTGWIILNWVLDGLATLSGPLNGILLLAGAVILGWLFFAMLGYWEKNNQHKLQCTLCKVGLGLCGAMALCDIGELMILLPFSWHWISYPLSLGAIAVAWFVMKDSQEMLTGTSQIVEGRTFGKKK